MNVVIVRQDRIRNQVTGDWQQTTERRREVRGCHVVPRFATEQETRERQGTVVGLVMYAPAGTDIVVTDSIEVDGMSYRIDGPPETWFSLDGRPRSLVTNLRRAVG